MIDARTTKRGWVRWLALALALGAGAVAIELSHPSAAAKPTPAEKGGAAPLSVGVVETVPTPHALDVTATGDLAPAEAVEIVSELSRRLVRVRAEEGATVDKGDVLFEVDAADLHARHARLRIARDLAARILARREAHSAGGAITAHELDVGRTEVAAVEAEMYEVAIQLQKTQIRAPFAGVLGTRNVSQGAWVTPDVVLTTLYDTSRFKLDFTLPERFASQLAVGATFQFSASGGKQGEGTIAVVEPSVDATSRSVRVRGIVAKGDGLVAGTFVTVTLKLAPRQALFVPTIAVEASPAGHAVWVVAEGRATRRVIEIGDRTPERMEVVKGLEKGEEVIVDNLLRLKEGAPVSVRAQP